MSKDQGSTCEAILLLCNMPPSTCHPFTICARNRGCLAHHSSLTGIFKLCYWRTSSVSVAEREGIENSRTIKTVLLKSMERITLRKVYCTVPRLRMMPKDVHGESLWLLSSSMNPSRTDQNSYCLQRCIILKSFTSLWKYIAALIAGRVASFF